MVYGITLILLSILAVPSLILSKRPDAQKVLDKVAPYQGWIGVAFCLWGIWGIISALLALRVLSVAPIWWVTWFAGCVVQALLGFLLGYNLIAKYALSGSEQAKKKGEELLQKISAYQGKIGIVGIAIGVWMIAARIMFYV